MLAQPSHRSPQEFWVKKSLIQRFIEEADVRGSTPTRPRPTFPYLSDVGPSEPADWA